uniref:Major capsid protein n=2 Tax=unclassified Crassvirales TaxID=2949298 RepID=A0AAU8MIP0_9CAUD
MYKLREVSRGNYDDRGYSNEETIAHLMLAKPEEINNVLTYTYGMDDDRFPLTFLTEGQGNAGVVDIATVQWTWKTMGRMKFNDFVLYFNTANTTPGKGGAMFEVEFKTHWLIEQYGLIAPDGVTQVRIMKDLGEGPHGGYLYRLKLTNPDPNAYVDPENLKPGKYWSMTAPTISESYSKGNRSNVMGPGKMQSQLEFHRYSKEIAGNISNVVVTYEFKTKSGGTTNLWINEEMRQHDIQCRIMDEERLWLAEYNRDVNGEIHLLDPDNGQPIPHTAGMQQICRESNYDTYGEVLTLNKIERTIGDVLDKDTDTGSMEVVLACGKGFAQDFDMAIRNDARAEGFATPLGDKMIEDFEGGLSYGKYFRRYKTVDGHIITLKHLPFLDNGTVAENAKANGMVHPRSGLPITSHQAFLIDLSTYQGVRNVRKVRQKGQIYKAGVLKGLTDIPASWGAVPTNAISTEIDMSRYEVKNSYGLQVNNATKMFQLKCVL